MTRKIMNGALVALAAVALCATPVVAGSHEDAAEMETPKEGSGGRKSASAEEASDEDEKSPADANAGDAKAPAPAPREGS